MTDLQSRTPTEQSDPCTTSIILHVSISYNVWYRVGIGISVYMPCFVCMVINVHVPLENFSLICFKESATKCLPMHGTPGSSSVGSVSCQRLL